MTAVFRRSSHATRPTAVTADGCYIVDSNGKRYPDACGGAASCLGHSNAKVGQSMAEATLCERVARYEPIWLGTATALIFSTGLSNFPFAFGPGVLREAIKRCGRADAEMRIEKTSKMTRHEAGSGWTHFSVCGAKTGAGENNNARFRVDFLDAPLWSPSSEVEATRNRVWPRSQ